MLLSLTMAARLIFALSLRKSSAGRWLLRFVDGSGADSLVRSKDHLWPRVVSLKEYRFCCEKGPVTLCRVQVVGGLLRKLKAPLLQGHLCKLVSLRKVAMSILMVPMT